MTAHVDLPTVCARARGLALHFLPRAELERLAGMPDVPSLGRALAQDGRLVGGVPQPATSGGIDAAVRRTARERLEKLALWSGGGPVLDFFYADQDRRSLRSILRGAMQGAPPEARLAGLLPTPRLPERALGELAREPTPAKVALRLVALRHYDAERLLPLARRAQPSAFELELALARGFVERAAAAARAGDANLREAVRTRVDVLNMETALAMAPASFLEGGASLGRGAFLEVTRSPSRADAAARLAQLLARTPLARLARVSAGDPVRLEREALVQALDVQRRRARADPLGSGPLLGFLLRLEAQARDVRRLAWGASLGAPAGVIAGELVTPWN